MGILCDEDIVVVIQKREPASLQEDGHGDQCQCSADDSDLPRVLAA
jgi:hypothetical protein